MPGSGCGGGSQKINKYTTSAYDAYQDSINDLMEYHSEYEKQKLLYQTQVYKTSKTEYDQKEMLVRIKEDSLRGEANRNNLPNQQITYDNIWSGGLTSNQLVKSSPPTLRIDTDLRERGIEILRLALNKPDKKIHIARRVRRIMGMNFIGNLPWEESQDWEACKALRDMGYLERTSQSMFVLKNGGMQVNDLQLDTRLDANGEAYTDVAFLITESGSKLIEELNEADPSFMVARNHGMVGEAGMRFLQMLLRNKGTLDLEIPLDLLDSDRRLQKLINHKLVHLTQASIQIEAKKYLVKLSLTQAGGQMVTLALRSNWVGYTGGAPWEPQRLAKDCQYAIEMLEQLNDDVLDYQEPLVVMPQIASTRKGRGGFGMTAKRFGGLVGDHTSLRWVGRKTTQAIELWKPEIQDAEFEEVPPAKAIGTGVNYPVKVAFTTAATTSTNVLKFPLTPSSRFVRK